MLSQVTRLLALVSAPPLEAATVRHVDVLQLQPNVVDGGRDHLDRRRHQAALRVPRAGRPRPRRRGRRLPRRAARRAPARLALAAPRLRRPERSARASARSCRRSAARSTTASDEDAQLYVGGAAGLLDDLRTEEIGAYRSLIDALEKRAALLDVLAQRLDPQRPFARVGDELEQPGLRDLALVGATYGSRTRRSARSACSGRCGWTTRRRCARSARPRTSCRASSKRCTRKTDGRQRAATTTSCSASRATPTRRRSRRRSASSRASCIPTSRSSRRPRCGSAR